MSPKLLFTFGWRMDPREIGRIIWGQEPGSDFGCRRRSNFPGLTIFFPPNYPLQKMSLLVIQCSSFVRAMVTLEGGTADSA